MTSTQEPAEQKLDKSPLHELISATIKESGGWIGFDHYMQLALYAPGLGYYSGPQSKFGESGDFITAPEMGELFGCCLAGQVAEVLEKVDSGSILEFGAGSGLLAVTIMQQLEQQNRLPKEYLILELSGDLRRRQQQTIRSKAGELYSRVRWLDTLPIGFRGVVIANEVLDAIPVKLFEQEENGAIWELGVALNETEDAFQYSRCQADASLSESVRALQLQFDERVYHSEISPQGRAWVNSLGEVVSEGVVLLIDYGFRQAEYYHSDRTQGTLMCHYRHHAHDDPFFQPGLQDLTAHVDFTAVAQAAVEAGFSLSGYASQGAFLLSAGILDFIPLDASIQNQLELAQQVKKLTLPHEMGELFKVLALSKAYQEPLSGFVQQNHIHRLQE